MKFLLASLLGLLTLLCAPLATANVPNVLIMGEDADTDTVPRNSRVFRRVLDAVANQMGDEGFRVFDETAVTLDEFAQGRMRRTDAELVDIGRSIRRPPIDVVVIFRIFASAEDRSYTTVVRSRIEGRLLNVQSGERLGNFEVESPRGSWNARPDCNRECILEVVGGNSRILANDLGAVLAEQLAWLIRDRDPAPVTTAGGSGSGGLMQQYVLEFDNFTPEDVAAIEEYLVIFSGYDSHRPIYTGARRAEFWYQSHIDSARLNRNLNRMLEVLDLRGVVQFSGNTYKVSNITRRRDRPDPTDMDW